MRNIFNELEGDIGRTLRVMNELGILGAIIPEFNDLIGFIQPGVYHAYTADEHTIVAIENVERLAKQQNELSSIFHSLADKDVLFAPGYLDLLFIVLAKSHDPFFVVDVKLEVGVA